MTLSKKLLTLRKEHGYSQMLLAEKLNVSRQSISKWESGNAIPSTDKLKFLSELYGVSLDYLLNDDAVYPSTEPKQKEPVPDKCASLRKNSILFTFLIGIVVIILLSVVLIQNQNKVKVTPLEEWSSVSEDYSSAGTFKIK